MTRPNALLFAVSCLFASALCADDIRLRSGGILTGEIAERTADHIVVDVDDGRITLPLSFVEQIIPRPMPRAIFRARAAALADADLSGWLSLAQWASSERLASDATSAYQHVLRLDPDNASANVHAGRLRLGERWVGPDEYYAARGYVRFENSWMPPERRDEIQRDRAIQAQRAEAARERDETRALVREAEERAREAEARAQTAVAQAREAAARTRAVESELARRRSRAEARHAAWRPNSGDFTVCTVNGRSFFCDPPDQRACCYDAPGPGCFEPPDHHHPRHRDERR
jgi:hypothetical protein